MQYARVIVNHPLHNRQELCYQIPARLLCDIKIGQLVEVRLRNRKTAGLVVGFSKKTSPSIKTLPIERLISQGAVICSDQLLYYRKIADLTVSSLSDVIFYFLPPLPKEIDVSLNCPVIKHRSGQLKFVIGSIRQRFMLYRQLIEKWNGAVFVLLPNQDVIDNFVWQTGVEKYQVLTGEDKPKIRWKKWQKAQSEKIITLCTRVGIGLISSQPALQIIDNPDHPGYKEDRRPKYQISELISASSRYTGQTVVGAASPSLLLRFLFNIKSYPRLPKVILAKAADDIPEPSLNRVGKASRVLIAVSQKYATSPVISRHIENQIKKMCSDKKIIRVEKNQQINRSAWDEKNIVVIATLKIFDYPVAHFDHVICFGFDSYINIPDPQQEEYIFNLLINFLLLGKSGEIITKRPEHRIYHAIAGKSVEKLTHELLAERANIYPPYTRLVNISYPKTFDGEVFGKISQIVPQVVSNSKGMEVQIAISRQDWKKARSIFDDLGPGWKIDPDPRRY